MRDLRVSAWQATGPAVRPWGRSDARMGCARRPGGSAASAGCASRPGRPGSGCGSIDAAPDVPEHRMHCAGGLSWKPRWVLFAKSASHRRSSRRQARPGACRLTRVNYDFLWPTWGTRRLLERVLGSSQLIAERYERCGIDLQPGRRFANPMATAAAIWSTMGEFDVRAHRSGPAARWLNRQE